MTRLLLITDDSSPALTIETALSSTADFQVHRRSTITEIRGALSAGAFEVVLLAPDRIDADLFGLLHSVREVAPAIPVVVAAPGNTERDAQTRLLQAGADSLLFAPHDPGAIATLLTRLANRTTSAPAALDTPPAIVPSRLNTKAAALSSALEVLRDFSQVMGYSLDYRQLTHHFLLKLREVIGITRIAIFLEPAPTDTLPGAVRTEQPHMPCAAAIGLTTDLVECFALTRKSGLGRHLTLQPQILRAATGTAAPFLDAKIAREFEVLGGLVAIPVNDRERTIGVAVLGGRITGGEFTDEELLLVYHLLEELGLAVKNSWLHHQLVGSHRLFSSMLDGLTVGALVVGPSHQILYANRAIIAFLRGESPAQLDIHDLPPALAKHLHEAVENGATFEPFFHETGGRRLRASILPLGRTPGQQHQSSLLLLEDFTQVHAAQRAEIESSNLKLLSLIARRFAHEIRNALVPLTTHAQLFDAEIASADFRSSLKSALTRETQRIQRFTDQMLLLARAELPLSDLVAFDDILRASFEKSRAFSGGEAELDLRSDLPPVMLRCHRASLSHAFQEIFLNGLQSGDQPARRVTVALNVAPTTDGRAELVVKVRDSGGGFAPDAVPRATEPFYTTRNTGIGLGLTIAQRVIEAHSGRLTVLPRVVPTDPDLTIHLPLPR